MRLGHCICDPRQSCPCPIFKEKDLCPCAGERPAPPGDPVQLTQMVENIGCASKISQADLRRILTDLPRINDPRVLIGMPAGDDAGVYKLHEQTVLVQTVDVFTPIVDDPYAFGQIAAANSLSDVYAMGGRPITALSIVGYPVHEAPEHALREILRGGMDKMIEAGVAVIGGHSINEKEIKAGFAVTGLVDEHKIMAHRGAQSGDALVLTKPIGSGILSFGARIGRAAEADLAEMTRSLAALNKTAAELMIEFGAHACTDVTGFGLMGHLGNLARAGEKDVEIVWDHIPVFPGVLACLAEQIIPGAVERNRESSGARVVADENVTPAMLDLCFDAQTSGGLLIALPSSRALAFVERLHQGGVPDASVIGQVLASGDGKIIVRTDASRPIPRTKPTAYRHEKTPAPAAFKEKTEMTKEMKNNVPCCADAVEGVTAGGVPDIQRKFSEFLKSASQPEALDAYTKQAIAIALSVLTKCEPCLKMHITKAREKGFTEAEIDEAAWMAISFGGSPVMMFYNQTRKA